MARSFNGRVFFKGEPCSLENPQGSVAGGDVGDKSFGKSFLLLPRETWAGAKSP